MNKKNSSFDNKNGLNFKLKHRKAQKLILCERFGDPYEHSERKVPYPGELVYAEIPCWKLRPKKSCSIYFPTENYFVNGKKKNKGLTKPSPIFFSDVILT